MIVGSPGAGLIWDDQYLVDELGSRDVVRLTAIVPEPSTAVLLGGALGLLGCLRRDERPARLAIAS